MTTILERIAIVRDELAALDKTPLGFERELGRAIADLEALAEEMRAAANEGLYGGAIYNRDNVVVGDSVEWADRIGTSSGKERM